MGMNGPTHSTRLRLAQGRLVGPSERYGWSTRVVDERQDRCAVATTRVARTRGRRCSSEWGEGRFQARRMVDVSACPSSSPRGSASGSGRHDRVKKTIIRRGSPGKRICGMLRKGPPYRFRPLTDEIWRCRGSVWVRAMCRDAES
jgi:hypothetical protein